MDNLQMLATLSKDEMMDMRMKGLSPLNPEDIKKYKRGETISLKEKEERAAIMFAGTGNLGGGGESDIDARSFTDKEFTPGSYEKEMAPVQKTQEDFRKNLNEEMGSYGQNTGKTFGTDDFLSFKKASPQPTQPVANNAEQIKLEGFASSKEYLNSFVLNLQTPNYQNRLNLFKSLQICLKGEEKYRQHAKALQIYRSGVEQAEKAMLKKLQG